MVVPSIIQLNSTTPAAPAGSTNVKPQSDGGFPIANVSFYLPTPFDVMFSPNAVLASSATYDVLVFGRTVTFAANFASSVGHCRVNPGSTQTITINKNGGSAGTISISSSGVFTFTTTGGTALTFNAGDYMQLVNQGSADASMIMSITLVGAR